MVSGGRSFFVPRSGNNGDLVVGEQGRSLGSRGDRGKMGAQN